ncbi:MAG: tRNA pseudouridine(55) synthase TruB [Christensenellales bacterium]|jgi:tRNA pseudouridine55 synthase
MAVEGVINVLKPAGMTSSDMINILRRTLDTRKMGHLGTLDPAAAGVLPVLAGRATKLFDLLNLHEKEYIAEFTFGMTTDTLDAQGNLLPVPGTPVYLYKKAVEDVLASFTGEIEQIPPMYSAIQYQGKRLYDLARKGISVELEPRRVTVYRMELMRLTKKTLTLRIACSKGTYIRGICRDIATALNTVGYVSFLLRTRTGMYRLEESYTLDALSEARKNGALETLAQPMDQAVIGLPEMRFPKRYAKVLLHGGGLDEEFALPREDFRAYCGEIFLGIGKGRGEKVVSPFRFKICLCTPPEA